jgi:hypothetical protein
MRTVRLWLTLLALAGCSADAGDLQVATIDDTPDPVAKTAEFAQMGAQMIDDHSNRSDFVTVHHFVQGVEVNPRSPNLAPRGQLDDLLSTFLVRPEDKVTIRTLSSAGDGHMVQIDLIWVHGGVTERCSIWDEGK